MRRYLVISAAILISSLLAATVAQAAPGRQDVLYEITSPRPNAEVRGSVEIVGSARLPDFDFYTIRYASSATPDAWIDIGEVVRQQKTNERLGIWQTSGLPDGAYLLRLVVAKQDGNAVETDPIRVQVVNAARSYSDACGVTHPHCHSFHPDAYHRRRGAADRGGGIDGHPSQHH